VIYFRVTIRTLPHLLVACAVGWTVVRCPAQTTAPADPPATATAPAADPPAEYPRIDLAPDYAVVPGWPRHPADWKPAAVPSIAIDVAGRIWAYTRSNPVVQVYSPEGDLQASWREADPRTIPHALRFDRDGNVWLVDVGLHVARRFDRDGRPNLVLGVLGEAGDDERHLDKPTDIAFDSDGGIYVSDGYGNNRVVHYDAMGRFVKSWGLLGVERGQFSLPHSIAVDSKDRVYVADRNNVRVQVFDRTGALLDVWSNVLVPWTFQILPDDSVWVCGSAPMTWSVHPDYPTAPLGCPPKDQLVMRFDTAGRIHELWTLPKGADGRERPGDVNWIHGLAVAADGSIYVGDIIGKRLQKFVRR
jgi:peptidylamidoglycolate lyase